MKDYEHDFTTQDLESTTTEEKAFAFDVFIDISSKYSVIQKFFLKISNFSIHSDDYYIKYYIMVYIKLN